MVLSATLALRTTPGLLKELEALCEALAETPYAAAGPLTRSRVADLAIRRGLAVLRSELAGEPVAVASVSPTPEEALPGIVARLEALVATWEAEDQVAARAATGEVEAKP